MTQSAPAGSRARVRRAGLRSLTVGLERCFRIGSGVLFIASGIAKVLALEEFTTTLIAHERLAMGPEDPAWQALAVAFVVLEIAIGIAAIAPGTLTRRTPKREHAATLAVAGFWTLLAGYAAWMLMQPATSATTCGCGILASGSEADWSAILIRNAFIAAAGFMLASRSIRSHRAGERG